MHILIISSGYPNIYEPLDGVFYRDQAEALVKSGNKVGVVSTIPVSIFALLRTKKWEFGRKIFSSNGVRTHIWSYLNRPKSPAYPLKKAASLGMKLYREYVRENGVPDIVHLHSYEGGLLALRLKREEQLSYIVTEHSSRFLLNTLPPALEPTVREIYQNATGRVAVSDFLRETLMNRYNTPFEYIPNIVDTASFYPTSTFPKNSEFTFLHVAGLNANKNQRLLIHAFSIVAAKHAQVQLIIAGDGELRSDLENLTAELMLSKKVTFVGSKSRAELLELYNKSHVFVLSSFRETFGVVIIEALSCGLPVVSTRCGGPESIIVSEKLGILSDNTTEALASSMEDAYEGIERFDPVVIRKYVEENFSIEAVANRLNTFYKKHTIGNER